MARKRLYGPLSQQLESDIAAHRESCVARQRSTEPADCDRVERGIAVCYRAIGLEPPKRVVWIDSPAEIVAGPIAAEMLWSCAHRDFDKKRGRVEDAVEAWVRPYVVGSVPEAVVDVVRSAVGPARVDVASRDANLSERLRDVCGRKVAARVAGALQKRVCARMHIELEHRRCEPRMPCARASDVPRRDAIVDATSRRRLSQPPAFPRLPHDTWRDVLPGRAGIADDGEPWLTAFVRDVIGADAVNVDDETWRRSRAYEDMQSAGNIWPHPEFCIVTHAPVEIHAELAIDELGRERVCLHDAEGPAVVWRDGTAQWYLNDFFLGSTPPSGALKSWRTVDRITAMPFPMTRRIVVAHYGRDRYVRAARAERIDVEYGPTEDERAAPRDLRYRALWRLEQPDDEPIVAVDVINQSPEPIGTKADGETYLAIGGRVWRRYMLSVPPTMSSCAEAVAWTCGKTAATYVPAFET